jgi:hypothetical protein
MGAVVYVAHPYWTQLSVADLASQEGFAGIEVFNASSELECGRGDSSAWWDELLGLGRPVFGIGTDDQHYPSFELGGGWTMLRVAERSEAAVLDALRRGHSYFSHGPQIHHIDVGDDGVTVECSPVRSVLLQGEEELGAVVLAGPNGRRQGQVLSTDGAGLLTSVRFEQSATRYRRVTVVDAHGRRAWSNPV